MTKAQVRTLMTERLATLTAGEFARLGSCAAQRLVLTSEYQQACALMVFLSMPGEIDTSALIRQAFQDGKTVLVPKVIWEERRLIPLILDGPSAALSKDKYGILNPVEQTDYPLDRIDLIATPGLAFDCQGNRLGRGAGFYDRFLAQPQMKALTCGFAPELQVLDHIPCEAHDFRLAMLATELQVRRFSPKRPPPND